MHAKVFCQVHGEIPECEEMIASGEPCCPQCTEVNLLMTHDQYMIATGQVTVPEDIPVGE